MPNETKIFQEHFLVTKNLADLAINKKVKNLFKSDQLMNMVL